MDNSVFTGIFKKRSKLVKIHQKYNNFFHINWFITNKCNYHCTYCHPFNYAGSSKLFDINVYKKFVSKILEQIGNLIRYWPYPRYSILKILDKPLIMLAPKSESLTLHFDGNVVYMRGIWFSVNKLKKQLKLLELF